MSVVPRATQLITHLSAVGNLYAYMNTCLNLDKNSSYPKILINAFKKRTGCSSIINTSFNIRGEPIVCTPQDAYRCFMRTEIDILVLQNQILYKNEQPKINQTENWENEFELD